MCSRRWLIALLAVCGLAAGCSEFNTNLTTQTSASSITFISPTTATAGGQGFTLNVTGAGFVNGSTTTDTIVLWNGIQLVTNVVSSGLITATVPTSYLATAGQVPIAVQILGSAVAGASGTTATTTTEISNQVFFTVNPVPGPLPTITSISASTTSGPSTPYCGQNGLTLTVNGTNFVNGATTVNWNSAPRATTFVSSSQVTAQILPGDTAFAGTASVVVSTASGLSNSSIFTMTTQTAAIPAPTISSLNNSAFLAVPPFLTSTATSIPTNAPSVTLMVMGNFAPCSTVLWNGSAMSTTFVSATQLNAAITPADQQTLGTYNVSVLTITPGGGTSTTLPFMITTSTQ